MIGASFPNQRVEILVNPENVKFVKLELTYQQISFQITVDNYQRLDYIYIYIYIYIYMCVCVYVLIFNLLKYQ